MRSSPASILFAFLHLSMICDAFRDFAMAVKRREPAIILPFCETRGTSMDIVLNSGEPAKLQKNGAAAKSVRAGIADDMAMIRAASELTRDLNGAKKAIYWADFLGSAFIGYAALFAAIFAPSTGLLLAAAVVSILALYRAGSFIHEITHIRHREVPWFRFGFNAVVGVPLLVPSFMYEGVHQLHHARTRYGTVEDPEYLPLALMKPWTVPLFVAVASLAPVGLLIRFGVLTPLSFLIPPLRRIVVERYSGLVINPVFRRRPPEGELKKQWLAQEIAASVWANALMIGVISGFIPLRGFLIFIAIFSATVVFNQIRTLVAHLWENEGEVITTTAKFLDSVNVPPPNILSALWAPVGLRYHATHHLLPGLPYHALGEAHRRLVKNLAPESTYSQASYSGLPSLVTRLVKSTFTVGTMRG
jgi:fatty acid desaturase